MSDNAFLQACAGLATERTPVWFMRQAGRYLPEYRAIRETASILEICHSPELARDVTLLPIDRLGVDAAIVFADILLPFEPLGLGLSFVEGVGPQIKHPVRSVADVDRLPTIDPITELGHVLETVSLTSEALGERVPVIGFAGAPFTLASYAIEGGPSRRFETTKQFMYTHPEAWNRLLDHFAVLVGDFLAAQARAGARALQLFDSWVGCLSESDYRRFVLPHSRRAIERAAESQAPLIHFGTGTGALLEAMASAGGSVVGVDWRLPLDQAWARLGDMGIQGNLDPALLQAPLAELRDRVTDVLKRAAGRPGHIFNLGHGVPPTTDPDRLRAVVDLVREWSLARL